MILACLATNKKTTLREITVLLLLLTAVVILHLSFGPLLAPEILCAALYSCLKDITIKEFVKIFMQGP